MDDQTEADSVFDFLYVDRQRIEVFLSQFGRYGHLKSMIKASLKSELTEGSVGLGSNKLGGNSKSDETVTSNYDAQWLAPLRFLDELATRSLISHGLENSGIGNFVLCKGSLSVLDLGVLQKMWGLPSLRNVMVEGVPKEPSAAGRSERRRDSKLPTRPNNDANFAFDVLGLVPHGAQAYLATDEGEIIWSALGADGLITSASDIMLNHGAAVAGDWVILGVLDAKPDDVPAELTNHILAMQMGADISAGKGVAPQMFLHLTPVVRNMVGRPPHAYGVTPILIFREVK